MFTPSDKILKNYADVLIKFALRGGKGVKQGETVLITLTESAKPILKHLQQAVLEAGAHPIIDYRVEGLGAEFYENANDDQIGYVPNKYREGLSQDATHRVRIIADYKKGALKHIDPKKIMARGNAFSSVKKLFFDKENQGKLSRTLALYGTLAMAAEVGLSEEEYWGEIINACYLDKEDPIAEWQNAFDMIQRARNWLTDLDIDYLHVKGEDADLKVKIGENRQWLAGSGRNIPSFEVYVSPDWRGTEGWIRFNQPLYRYGNIIKGIELHFEKGIITKATAKENEELLLEMINTKNANKIGEYSLTDKRISRITKFMGETLYDENVGGPYGNTHLAVGMSYKDSFTGDIKAQTEKDRERMGFNDSTVHTDIMSTTDRVVTAYLKDGSSKVIYKDGMFQYDM